MAADDEARAYQKARREQRKEQGLCRECPAAAVPGRVRCRACAKEYSQRTRSARFGPALADLKNRVATGPPKGLWPMKRCVVCGGVVKDESLICGVCQPAYDHGRREGLSYAGSLLSEPALNTGYGDPDAEWRERFKRMIRAAMPAGRR